MSTKQESNSTNTLQYDPKSKGNYDSLTGAGSKTLLDWINNPFGNVGYKLGLGQSQQGATQQGNNNIQALLQQMKTSGISGQGGNAFQMGQMGKIGRANASMMSQANISNIMNAFNRQGTATGMGMSFNPLLTGTTGHQTQTTSGLGTWLPQLLSAGLGAATGGMSTMAQGAAKTATSAGSGMSTGSPFSGGGIGFSPTMGAPPNPLVFGGG